MWSVVDGWLCYAEAVLGGLYSRPALSAMVKHYGARAEKETA